MRISDGFTDAIGNTPLIRLRRVERRNGVRDPGQSRVHESRRFGEGSRGEMDRFGRRAARTLETGRYRGRGYRGQHGHRLGACLQCARLSMRDRHARQSGGRKISNHRGSGGAIAQGTGRALQQPEPIPKGGGSPGGGVARRDLGKSIRQYREPRCALRVDGPRDLARYRRQNRRLLRVHGHRRHAGGRCPLS